MFCVLSRIIVFVAANAFFMMKEGKVQQQTNKQTNQEADKLQRVQTCDIKLAAPGPG